MKQLKITKFPALDYAGNEAFNTLSTNLSFAGANVKKIMITSCHAAEGKSYLAMNLMRTLAQRGIKVALVDADLRRSMLNSDYGLKYEDGRSDGKGLSHFLAGMVGMDEVIYQTDIPNAIMVPVLASDTAETLAARVLRLEHILYPRAVYAVASGRVRIDNGRTVTDDETAKYLAIFDKDNASAA